GRPGGRQRRPLPRGTRGRAALRLSRRGEPPPRLLARLRGHLRCGGRPRRRSAGGLVHHRRPWTRPPARAARRRPPRPRAPAPRAPAATADALRRLPLDPTFFARVPEFIRRGGSLLATHLPPEALTVWARTEEHLRVLRAIEPRSALCVPLVIRDRVVGALTL